MLGRLSIEDIKDSIVREQSPFKPGDIVMDVETLKEYVIRDCIWKYSDGWQIITDSWNYNPEDLIKVENGKETT